jgi:hypothetical protein
MPMMRARKFHVQSLRRSGARREAAAWSLRLTCDASRFGLFGPVNVWSYPTFPPPIQSELFDTDSESDPAQSQQMLGAFKPPDPPSARAVYVRTRPRRGLAGVFAFVCREDAHHYRSPNVCRVRISHLSGVAMVKVLQVPRRQRAERVARDLNYVVIESLRSVLKHGGVDAFDKAAGHVITAVAATNCGAETGAKPLRPNATSCGGSKMARSPRSKPADARRHGGQPATSKWRTAR